MTGQAPVAAGQFPLAEEPLAGSRGPHPAPIPATINPADRVIVEIAAAADPLDPPDTEWVDVTRAVTRISLTRGRNRLTQPMPPGKCLIDASALLDRLDPLHPRGPRSGSPIRVSSQAAGTTRRLWTGYVRRAPLHYGWPSDATVRLSGLDGLAFLAQETVNINIIAHNRAYTAAAQTLLTAAGWTPTVTHRRRTGRAIGDDIIGLTGRAGSVLNQLVAVAGIDAATFIDAAGRLNTVGGYAPAATATITTLPDLAAGDLRPSDVTPDIDEDTFATICRAIDTGYTPTRTVTHRDTGAVTAHGPHERRITAAWASATNAADDARAIVDRYQHPQQTYDLDIDITNDTTAVAVTTLDLLDTVTFALRPPSQTNDTADQQFTGGINQIRHEITKTRRGSQWRTGLKLARLPQP